MWWFEKCLSINHYKSLSKDPAGVETVTSPLSSGNVTVTDSGSNGAGATSRVVKEGLRGFVWVENVISG